MINNSSKLLVPSTLKGQKVLRASLTDSAQASQNDPVLVKRDPEGQWSPVDKLEKSVDRKELAENYGLWSDKEIKKGGVLGFGQKTVRAQDGEIQPDEVSTFKPSSKSFRSGRHRVETHHYVGGEIAQGDGFAVLRETSVEESAFTEATPETADAVFHNDEMWLVR